MQISERPNGNHQVAISVEDSLRLIALLVDGMQQLRLDPSRVDHPCGYIFREDADGKETMVRIVVKP